MSIDYLGANVPDNTSFCPPLLKLDGVGTVNNRPSPAMLHRFIKKKKKK